jgi:hypothetical protein
MKIWISHSFSDIEFVDKLKKVLIAQGYEILTLDHSMMAGEYLLEKITKSISEADALLLVMSKNFVKSPWINTEIGLIISQSSTKLDKIFIPIMIDKGLNLPSYLAHYYYIDYTNDRSFEENTTQILRAIRDRSSRGHDPQIQKSISQAIKQQEMLLKASKLDYELKRKKQQSFKTFTILTVITTFLSSIILILFFVKSENSFVTKIMRDWSNIISFIIGVVFSTFIVAVFSYTKKRNK